MATPYWEACKRIKQLKACMEEIGEEISKSLKGANFTSVPKH